MKKISKIHARLQKTIIGRLISPKPQPVHDQLVVETSSDIRDGDPKSEPKKRVIFMGRDAVSRHKFNPEDVLISISDSGVTPPELIHQPLDMLAMAFNDHVTDRDVKELGWRRMSREDGAKIVEFVLKHTSSPNIVVHCNVGQSRSKGAALAIAEINNRDVLHANDRGYVRAYKKGEYDYYNHRVYEMILMEYEISLCESEEE